MKIGLDIGSTTIKAAVLNGRNELVFSHYERHLSRVSERAVALIDRIRARFPALLSAPVAVSGSAGMGMADKCGVDFVQEVHATRVCAERMTPDADVIIELGGEDAKILFLSGLPDARMNGSCAGGTGAFIDQMASLLDISLDELDARAAAHEKIYPIASRCGVFAKSDVQPLINQGAREADIAASILAAVVNQTIAGLAQGRPIRGKVLYLGGPMSFLPQLRRQFDAALGLRGVCPEHSLYFVATGAALSATREMDLSDLRARLVDAKQHGSFDFMEPLFKDAGEYAAFSARHAQSRVPRGDINAPEGGVYLGVDAGSTTLKTALVDGRGALLESTYQTNRGNPAPILYNYLVDLYRRHPDIDIRGSASTGYGEALIKEAFALDMGVVETVAHFAAARALEPEVDFILDIGGQDIKCMATKNGVIDHIYLNEACSSGCGSFLQTFAGALDMDIDTFARLGLFADRPVDLGSRCTVFMNSSVKHAQKEGASVENISAGLSIGVIKNALYKVIRPTHKQALGKRIVVQGGTFSSDAVLRAFEKEMDLSVIRPDIAGVMGAYGAALTVLEARGGRGGRSSVLSAQALAGFEHTVRVTRCGLCENRCALTVNRFGGGRRAISGNRCERPVSRRAPDDSMNMYRLKLDALRALSITNPGRRGVIGLPMGLNMYELLPFWRAFFEALEIGIAVSPASDHALYLNGLDTIPSDTVCYPAKLMHGHVRALIDGGIETLFYPCMSYNIDDGLGDNCYNCPVVAYYPEVINANMPDVARVRFIHGYVGLHRPRALPGKILKILRPFYGDLTLGEVRRAVRAGFSAHAAYLADQREAGRRVIRAARAAGRPIVVLAGRPYHIDREINHGIDQLIAGLGAAVISEDALCFEMAGRERVPLRVLNQWTYHGRLYAAAEYAAGQPDMEFVQLVSFGCGCDAVTTDECRRILEDAGRIYTQIKIDEIENLGAARIRLRSLFAAAGWEDSGGRPRTEHSIA